MKEDVSNPNIEWKKNNSDPSERLTLRINHKEAAAYSATKKNSFNAPAMPVAENLPKGLKKIRKKIRKIDVRSGYEDEDDEDFQYIPDSLEQLNQANSLMNALNDEEKRLLQQQESLLGMLILYQRVPVWRDRSLPGSRYWRYGKQDDCTFGRKSVILEHITKRWQQRTGYYQQKRIK